MVYLSATLFLLGLVLLAIRLFMPLVNQNWIKRRVNELSVNAAGLLIFSSCIAVGYAVMFSVPSKPITSLGDFGMQSDAVSLGGVTPAASPEVNKNDYLLQPSARPSTTQQAPGNIASNSMTAGLASVFSVAQASQICEGFSDVAMGALFAGARGESFSAYEQRSRQLGERALRLPFVRDAGTKAMQQINSLFATLIEEQYYISPKNRSIQLGLIAKVERKMALDAMTQICELRILEIREK